MSRVIADPGSFRDPSGRVFVSDTHVYRAVSAVGQHAFKAAYDSGALRLMIDRRRLVGTRLIDGEPSALAVQQASDGRGKIAHVLEHQRVPIISYPFEWPFEALRAAAMAHLDLHLDLLQLGFTLSDASAYNMQFEGSHPIHIDALSVVPYSEGERWVGYDQFMREFLNPLVLEAETGASFAPWYRGSLNGLSSDDLLRLLPRRCLFRPAYLMHVAAPALLDRRVATIEPRIARTQLKPLPKTRLIGLLKHLRLLISGLPSPRKRLKVWAEYTENNTYADGERQAKRQTVAAFVNMTRPRTVLDIGCNTGTYSRVALAAGATRVVGLDTDRSALDICYLGAARDRLDLLPLAVDLTNPSPGQGWRNVERQALLDRLSCDALLALAVIHHIVMRNNVPLAEAIRHLVSLAPLGLIEFVPKTDPQVTRLLRLRRDVFHDYTVETCRTALLAVAQIISESDVSATGRRLFVYAVRGGKFPGVPLQSSG